MVMFWDKPTSFAPPPAPVIYTYMSIHSSVFLIAHPVLGCGQG